MRIIKCRGLELSRVGPKRFRLYLAEKRQQIEAFISEEQMYEIVNGETMKQDLVTVRAVVPNLRYVYYSGELFMWLFEDEWLPMWREAWAEQERFE